MIPKPLYESCLSDDFYANNNPASVKNPLAKKLRDVGCRDTAIYNCLSLAVALEVEAAAVFCIPPRALSQTNAKCIAE